MKCHLNLEIEKTIIKKIIDQCKNLQMLLMFQTKSLPQILTVFIEKMICEIKILPYYQILAFIFKSLEYFNLFNLIDSQKKKFKEEWQRNQRQAQDRKFSRKTIGRDSFFIPSKKQNMSLDSSNKVVKENTSNLQQNQMSRTMTMSVPNKMAKQQIIPSQKIQKTNFKKLAQSTKTKNNINQTRRKTLGGNRNKFEFQAKKSNYKPSQIQNQGQMNTKYQINDSRQMLIFSSQQYGIRGYYGTIETSVQMDVLVENTPQRKKRK